MAKTKLEREFEIPLEAIKDLLTESESRMIKQRAYILELLTRGLSIRAIAKKAGVGTDTVVRMAKKLRESDNLKKTFRKASAIPHQKWTFGQSGRKE